MDFRCPGTRRWPQEMQGTAILGRDDLAWPASSPSALFTTTRSAISTIPRLMPCSSSPPPGAMRSRKVSTMSATAVSDWPTPTVSTMTTSKPAASQTSMASRVRRATPPRFPPMGGRPNEGGRIPREGVIRVLSPRIEPPERLDDGSTASTATRCPAPVNSTRLLR